MAYVRIQMNQHRSLSLCRFIKRGLCPPQLFPRERPRASTTLLLLHYHFAGWSTVRNRGGKEVCSGDFTRFGRCDGG